MKHVIIVFKEKKYNISTFFFFYILQNDKMNKIFLKKIDKVRSKREISIVTKIVFTLI